VAAWGQVMVQVAGISFNLPDVAIRAGIMQEAFAVAFPHIPNIGVACR
jgi:NADPH:quinone reductase-like Zn-dependent oxidoreductase